MNLQTFDFISKILIDLISVFIIVRYFHYSLYKKSEYIFTYVIFNITIFFLSYILQGNEISMGAAFGLFAVFSMIRYRTEDISARDMTYLFIFIALGLVNSVHKMDTSSDMAFWTSVATQVLYNAIIIFIIWLLESNVLLKREGVQTIQYENIENIKPENREKLIVDLTNRTGLKINRVYVTKIDFLKDTAVIKIYYEE